MKKNKYGLLGLICDNYCNKAGTDFCDGCIFEKIVANLEQDSVGFITDEMCNQLKLAKCKLIPDTFSSCMECPLANDCREAKRC